MIVDNFGVAKIFDTDPSNVKYSYINSNLRNILEIKENLGEDGLKKLHNH